MTQRPTVIDLFSGVGGFSLGFEQAGFDIVTAVEIDPVHAAIHHFNFPRCATLPHSVRSIDSKAIEKAVAEKSTLKKKIDVVVGGAPCQGFSLIGKRALDDPRNGLVKDFLRIVEDIQPKYFVFENVKGLTIGRHKEFLLEIIEESENIGYEITKPWQVLNAANYGVPQSRERLFLLGTKAGLTPPVYPEAREYRPTCQEALEDIPDAESFSELCFTDETMLQKWSSDLSPYAQEMRCITRESWHFGYQRIWNPLQLTSSWRTNHTDITRTRFRRTQPGTVEKTSRFFKLPPDGVANTLRAGTDSARGAFTSPRPIHYKYDRCVTVREMARLHGFPDWFRLHPTKWHGARQIGNAVPPPLARAIAGEVLKAMNHKPQRPKKIMSESSLEMLQLNMSSAAQFWGIPIPISRRDRKSGQKKRKQEEIGI